MNKTPDLSISIVSWNNKGLLQDCIQSVLNTVKKTKYELIVVDNASNDGSGEMVKRLFPQVILIANESNKFFSGANNQAIERGSGRHVLILNDDLVVKNNAIDNMVDFMERTPEAVALGAKLLNSDGTLQQLYYRSPTIWRSVLFDFNNIPFFCRLFMADSYLWKKYRVHYLTERLLKRGEFEVDQPPATCIMVRRSAIDRVGGMDPLYKLLWDDVDWCYRMRRLGKFYYLPTAEVVHYHGTSQRRCDPEERKKEYYFGATRYFQKNHGKLQLYLFKFLVQLMYFSEKAIRVFARRTKPYVK